MGKFTGASGSEWKMIAASGNGVWGQRQRLAMSYGGYNRLELVPRISSFRLVPDGSAAAGITGSRPAGLRTRRVLPVPSVAHSWPFPLRALRHTLLRSCGSLRRGASL